MIATPLAISGTWVFDPTVYSDSRGEFSEVFKSSAVNSLIGKTFEVKQSNQSLSAKGVIRGIHWTNGDIGQAKFVSCSAGAFWDVVVDLRPDSKTFGQWDSVLVSSENHKSVLIMEGIGHAFLSLSDNTVANYLCTAEYNPSLDRTLNPLDKNLAIDFKKIAFEHGIEDFILSDKDRFGESFRKSL